jgi:hypothetical protein
MLTERAIVLNQKVSLQIGVFLSEPVASDQIVI